MSGKDAYVVGGGNSAGQAVLHLARYARQVVLVVRARSLEAGMSNYLVREIEATPNVDVRTGTAVVGGGGEGRLQPLVLNDSGTGEQETVAARRARSGRRAGGQVAGRPRPGQGDRRLAARASGSQTADLHLSPLVLGIKRPAVRTIAADCGRAIISLAAWRGHRSCGLLRAEPLPQPGRDRPPRLGSRWQADAQDRPRSRDGLGSGALRPGGSLGVCEQTSQYQRTPTR